MISRSGTRTSGASSGVTKILRDEGSGPVVTAGSVVSGLERMFMVYPPVDFYLSRRCISIIIARSVCNEAIHRAVCVSMDCFALAMTGRISRGLRVHLQPRAHPRVGIWVLRHVADHGDGIGAGGENLGGLFELDAADRDQRDSADALLPFGDLRDALRREAHRFQRGRED